MDAPSTKIRPRSSYTEYQGYQIGKNLSPVIKIVENTLLSGVFAPSPSLTEAVRAVMDRSSPRTLSVSSEGWTRQEAWESTSETFRRVLESLLEHEEKRLAWFAPDLDHSSCYGRTPLLVLTDRRLLCLSRENEDRSEVGIPPYFFALAATNDAAAASATKRFPAGLRWTPSVVRMPRSLSSGLFFFR